MSDESESKVCGVCGGQAIGKNFGALTCGPCKAFFRRNAYQTAIECYFGDKCQVSVVTRKFCPKCRLNKCFEIGMKKEWILSDEEREVMRQKVEENRQKRRKTEMTTNSSTDNQRYNNNNYNFYGNIETIVSQNTYNNNRLNEVNRNTVNTSAGDLSLDFNSICDDFEMFEPTIAAVGDETINNEINQIENSLINNVGYENSTINNNDGNTNDGNTNDNNQYLSSDSSSDGNQENNSTLTQYSRQNTYNNANRVLINITTNQESSKTLNFDHIFDNKSLFPNIGSNSPGDQSVVPIGRPITDHNRDFNETEGRCLYELLNALMLLKDPEPQHAKEVTSYWELCEWMVIKFDSMIRDIIRLSKRLAAFQTLDEHDKQILIKNSCVEIILIRSAVVYDYELGFWDIFVKNNDSVRVKLDILKESPLDVYTVCKQFLVKAKRDCESDSIIFDLLTAIVLFDPKRPNLVNRDVVKLQQQIYLYLLRRYLALRYQPESEIKFAQTLSLLNDLYVWGDLQRKSSLTRDPNHLGPLLTEILDINQ